MKPMHKSIALLLNIHSHLHGTVGSLYLHMPLALAELIKAQVKATTERKLLRS